MKKFLLFLLYLLPGFAQGQTITTIAGTGVAGYSGDGGPATSARVSHPAQITMDAAGNIYFAETNNSIIRKINTSGIISTVAGTGVAGYSGDGGPATSAQLNGPYGVDVDAAGNLYISDFFNNRMRKVNTSGIITTIAGTGMPSYSGDGGPATAAELYFPGFFRLDNLGNIFISDNGNMRIRKINTSGIISTIAGNGVGGYSGDGGPATAAEIYYPDGISVDNTGNVFIGDAGNNVVRKVNTSGVISTFAGTGAGTFSGDGGPASSADLNIPQAIFADNTGNVFIPDTQNGRIRKVNASGIINTICGRSTIGYNGDGIPAITAQLNGPNSVYVDNAGNIYISDCFNQRIRKISAAAVCNISVAVPDSVHVCHGDTTTIPAVLSGTSPVSGISWTPATGLSSNTILTPVLTATTSGWYHITVQTTLQGCAATDSVFIDVTPSTSIYNHTDTSICTLTNGMTLYAPVGYTSDRWNTGVSTSTVTVADSGTYWVVATGFCTLQVDTFHIIPVAPKSGSFTQDTAVCPGTRMLNGPSYYANYLWSTGATTSSIFINTAGTYWVADTNINNCTMVIDTIHVTELLLPVVELGNDTSICPGDSMLLSLPEISGTYLWSTGSTATSITVYSGGVYVLTVTQNGCSASDSILITQNALPNVNLGPDTAICNGDVYVLNTANTETLWSTGISATNISVTAPGTYWASETNICGTVVDSVHVDFVVCDLFFPSGFTPNDDGRNDIARAVGDHLNKFGNFSLKIYNRWGQQIFHTEDIYAGWDGTFNGEKQDLGVYYYMIVYNLEGKRHSIKGDLTLIR